MTQCHVCFRPAPWQGTLDLRQISRVQGTEASAGVDEVLLHGATQHLESKQVHALHVHQGNPASAISNLHAVSKRAKYLSLSVRQWRTIHACKARKSRGPLQSQAASAHGQLHGRGRQQHLDQVVARRARGIAGPPHIGHALVAARRILISKHPPGCERAGWTHVQLTSQKLQARSSRQAPAGTCTTSHATSRRRQGVGAHAQQSPFSYPFGRGVCLRPAQR